MKASKDTLVLDDRDLGDGLASFEAGLEAFLDDGSWKGAVDWTGVTRVSVRALLVLAALARRFQAHGGAISSRGLAPELREQVELLGFDSRYFGTEN
jgi:anti-anti-sigma regulatory factor